MKDNTDTRRQQYNKLANPFAKEYEERFEEAPARKKLAVVKSTVAPGGNRIVYVANRYSLRGGYESVENRAQLKAYNTGLDSIRLPSVSPLEESVEK